MDESPTKKIVAGEFHKAPPGSMAWAWLKRKEPPHDTYVSICLRVRDGDAHEVIREPYRFDLDCKPIKFNDIVIVFFMIKIHDYPFLFSTPINHWSETYKSPLHYWRDCSVLRIELYENDSLPVRTDDTQFDGLGGLFGPVVEYVEKFEMWSESEFWEAVKSIPMTPEDIWNATG